jgi:hypothetical protein
MHWTDDVGRRWEVLYLSRGIDLMLDCLPCDATHRGFRYEDERRLYEFRPGDDRSEAYSALVAQFAAAKKVPTITQSVARRPPPEPKTRSRGEAVQDLYDLRRRGMGPR